MNDAYFLFLIFFWGVWESIRGGYNNRTNRKSLSSRVSSIEMS